MTLAANPPIEIPLERMTGEQKWSLFQTLWDDLSGDTSEEARSPDWHADVLRERLEREERGEAVWRSVDETFDRIRAQIANGR
ncbi:MAG: addiction module protein [Prosthecobacter sp.]